MDYDAHIWEDPLPIQKLRELEKISAILYFNSKLKSPDLNFDTILKESESSIYETLHRFNDPLQGCKYLFLRFARDSGCSIGVFDDCTQFFDEVAESLENPEFDWTRNLILKVAPRNGGHAEYFLFRVAKAAVKGQIEILMEFAYSSLLSATIYCDFLTSNSSDMAEAAPIIAENLCHTKVMLKIRNYLWTIDDYESVHCKRAIALYSSNFSASDDKFKWRLHMRYARY